MLSSHSTLVLAIKNSEVQRMKRAHEVVNHKVHQGNKDVYSLCDSKSLGNYDNRQIDKFYI